VITGATGAERIDDGYPDVALGMIEVASPDVVYDNHHTNLGLMFYTAACSSGSSSFRSPSMTRMRARVSDSADM
jgi:hypothetical protein